METLKKALCTIFVAVLVLGASVIASNPTIYFEGTILQEVSYMFSAGYEISVASILEGPSTPCESISVTTGGGVMPRGYIEPGLQVGDKVLVFGEFFAHDCYVDIRLSEHFLKKASGPVVEAPYEAVVQRVAFGSQAIYFELRWPVPVSSSPPHVGASGATLSLRLLQGAQMGFFMPLFDRSENNEKYVKLVFSVGGTVLSVIPDMALPGLILGLPMLASEIVRTLEGDTSTRPWEYSDFVNLEVNDLSEGCYLLQIVPPHWRVSGALLQIVGTYRFFGGQTPGEPPTEFTLTSEQQFPNESDYPK